MTKKDKNIRRKFRFISTTDFKVLETDYKEMAADGWLIDNIKGSWDTYKRTEPKALDFSVNIFQPDLIIDYPNQDKRDLYEELCAESGWQHMCHNNLLCVHAKEEESSALAIHTDSHLEYKSILKGFIKGEGALVLLVLFQILQFIWNLKLIDFMSFVRGGGLFTLINPIMVFLMGMIVITPSFVFLHRNYHISKNGLPLVFDSAKKIRIQKRVKKSALVIYLLYLIFSIVSMVFSGIPIKIFLVSYSTFFMMAIVISIYMIKVKKIKHSRFVNGLILVIIFLLVWAGSVFLIFSVIGNHSEEPIKAFDDVTDMAMLSFEDLGYKADFDPYTYDQNSSYFVEFYQAYRASGDDGDDHYYLNVEFFKWRNTFISDLMKELILDEAIRYYELDTKLSDLERNQMMLVDHQNPLVDQVYYLTDYQSKLLIVKESEMYIVRLGEAIDGDLINTIINSLYH